MTPAVRRAAPWALAWFLLASLLLLLDLASGFELTDQTWFQHVLSRVLDGDELYGAVFFGVPPLSVWLSLPVAEAVGPDPAVVKGLCAATAAATALVAVGLAGRLGVGFVGQGLVGIASVAYLAMPSITPYNPLASMFALVTLAFAIRWLDRDAGDGRAGVLLAAAGAAAGLSATSKHSVGLAALAALLLVVALLGRRPGGDLRGRLTDLALVFGSAAVVTAVVMAPVVASGSFGDFSAYAFEKGEYVRSASISYLDGFDALGVLLRSPLDYPRLLFLQLVFLIPPLAFGLLALSWRADPRRAAALALFLAAALVAALPRAAGYNVGFVVPVAAVCIAWSLKVLEDRVGGRVRLAVVVSLGALLGLTAALTLFEPAGDALDRGDDPSGVDGLSGPLAPEVTKDALRSLGSDLAAADRDGGGTFVLSPTAGAAYIVSGVQNPSPFDYPLNTAVRDSDAELIASIESGEIERVCLGPFEYTYEPLAPERLIAYVRERMTPSGTVGDPGAEPLLSCELYERGPRAWG